VQKGQYLQAILRSPKTVFSARDIALIWGETSSEATRVRLSYYSRRGDLYRIRRGLYAKDRNYSKLELATRIFTPAYVSFETVLAREGLIFQFSSQICVASYLTRELTVNGQAYAYRKIRNSLLTHPAGVEHSDESSIAGRERAFLDTLYVNADYHFDNLGGLDWTKVFEVLPIYDNKRMTRRVRALHEAATRTNQSK